MWAVDRWPWPVVLGEITGPWSKARAVSVAIAHSDADVLVVADADVWCDATEAVRNVKTWAVPHRCIRRLNQTATDRVLSGTEPQDLPMSSLEEPAYRSHHGGGVVVLKREVWDEVPMDPRFLGWGHEDDAWGIALYCLAGLPWLGHEHLWHLWHPPQERRARTRGSQASLDLYHRYAAAQSNPQAMAALLDEFKGAG